jgi:uncharacterized protein (DUF1697 family)
MGLSVALLRAVNVGAANRIRMDALRAVFLAAGYDDAVTYIQTGNVVFTATSTEDASRATIERQINNDLGLSITTILRTGDQMAAAVASNPFVADTDDATRLYVGFLAGEPSHDDVAALKALAFGEDAFRVVGREIYLRYAVRSSQSKLTGALIERKLHQPVTVRNWAVTMKLAEMTR